MKPPRRNLPVLPASTEASRLLERRLRNAQLQEEFFHADNQFLVKPKRRPYSAKYGHLCVFLLFLWLRVADAFFIGWVYPRLYTSQQQLLTLCLIGNGVWTSGLLLILWVYQKNWARFLLLFTLLFAALGLLAQLPGVQDWQLAVDPNRGYKIIFAGAALYLPAALFLALSPDLRKMTEGRY